MPFQAGRYVRLVGGLFFIKPSEVIGNALVLYLSPPFPSGSVEVNTLQAALVALGNLSVAHILCMGAFSEIIFPIVQTITINMVDHLPWICPNDHPVH